MTELEAANKALILLGVENIESLSDDIQAARIMKGLMESTRRAILSEFPWTFALQLRPLEASPQAAPPGWGYTWRYPDDAAVLYQVYESNWGGKIRYAVRDGVICTHAPAGNVEYSVMVPLEEWPHMAAEALVNRLASDAAVALTGSASLSMTLLQKYQAIANMAKGNSMNGEYAPRRRPMNYVEVRDYGDIS